MCELDSLPSITELTKAFDSLASGKAPGKKTAIPQRSSKPAKTPICFNTFHELLCQCWEEGTAPQDMRDANTITLYKNKGDRGDCNNYRRISLLSIVGKAFAHVIPSRLQLLASRIYPESHCGFRKSRSTIDMIFSIRQLKKKSREQNMPLYMAFIDLTKAFDFLSRKGGHFLLLQKIGCPPKLLIIIKSFHDDMQVTTQRNGSTSIAFQIKNRVKQGCIFAPTLFGIFSLLLSNAFETSEDGMFLNSRNDGQLFNLLRLRANTKIRSILIKEMLFADDAALVSHTEALQRLINYFEQACSDFGLVISLKKTNIMDQTTSDIPGIHTGDHRLQERKRFTYLGSTVTYNLSLDTELNIRIAKATAVMAELSKRAWDNNKLNKTTNMKIYQSCILSTLRYGSEIWTPYTRQEPRLNIFHLRCLRKILGIKWHNRVPKKDVLKQVGIPSMFALRTQRRMRWLGHVNRMEVDRITKDILYGELARGTRSVGRPLLPCKDVCKRDMKACDISIRNWEEVASNRGDWRRTIEEGGQRSDRGREEKWKDKKRRQQETMTSQPARQSLRYICIGLRIHSRRCIRT
ncbi:uncharacterized protein LOC106872601 [Octopus bimaculoides]|uniref:uncharacterized protein LOC106872601 n=1 Tax=Octopus bimaculoides TaxID=37653 RepID=UPI00071CB15B|nr:uncharacterized protein LOC106872601 [Octopus bimaculoides]|eukprot:XP_014775124.1 PREDICTED: uncharacterized protein LOC106872601 [Octopus bimaculoides]